MTVYRYNLRSRGDQFFDLFVMVLLSIGTIIVLYPLYFIVISSVSDPVAVNDGRVILWPADFSLDGYKKLLSYEQIWRGYLNSIIYTVVGTMISVVLTLTASYVLIQKKLVGRTFFMTLIILTMFFSGGLIPTYLVVKELGLLNSIGAMVLPAAVSAWVLIIARTFLQATIPQELSEAASIDGCSHFRFFYHIVVPLSPTLMAIMTLFYGVANWNKFFDALIYLRDPELYPLQLVLRNILIINEAMASELVDQGNMDDQARIAEQIKYGLIIVASVPMLALYPFLQKYFVKGILIGGIKE